MSKDILVFSCAHADPLCTNERFNWLGEYIHDTKPDMVIDLGDGADMRSLNSYDTRYPQAVVTQSYEKDIEWYNDMMHAMKSKFPDIVHVVNYKDMVEDPQGTLNSMADICGLPHPQGQIAPVPDDRGCAEPYKEYLDL